MPLSLLQAQTAPEVKWLLREWLRSTGSVCDSPMVAPGISLSSTLRRKCITFALTDFRFRDISRFFQATNLGIPSVRETVSASNSRLAPTAAAVAVAAYFAPALALSFSRARVSVGPIEFSGTPSRELISRYVRPSRWNSRTIAASPSGRPLNMRLI